MPANNKYLNKSISQRFAKISSGIIGGYVISSLVHMCLALLSYKPKEFLITSIWTLFVLWCGLMIVPFLFKNGWKAWGLYLIIIGVLLGVYSVAITNNPFV